ncbi:cell wall glucanase protein [Gigaspora margarita]|uniref:Cell wall glucanase protein n=1 Tax=Gigaspora margarita TaxID=4874 RepID=A0A8H4ELS0_GIGMA|nr:cell wall glucanase protein [Gigaspora margarita]
MSLLTIPNSQSSSSRASSSREASSDLGDFSPLWSYLENDNINNSLGDFGRLWGFLQGEKEKWRNSGSASIEDIDGFLTSSGQPCEVKQPPVLPHSSSSEYSSEEEILIAKHKANKTNKAIKVVQPSKKKIEGVVVVTVNKGNEKVTNKKSRKGKKSSEHKLNKDVVKTIINEGNKKVHFDNDVNSSNNQKQSLPALLVNNQKPYDRFNSKMTFKFSVPIPIKISDDPIHVFIDNSNILVGFLAYCRKQSLTNRTQNKPRLEYDALFTILERGRNVARRVLVASSPLYQPLDKAAQTGYEVSVLKRVKRSIFDDDGNTQQIDHTVSGYQQQQSPPFEMEKEQCVDELLHLKILESLLDYHAPATLVLASGDGKDAEYFQGGFHKCIIKALERGWKVEVISWQRQLSQNFLNKKFLSKWQGLYHVVFLDWFAKELGCDM